MDYSDITAVHAHISNKLPTTTTTSIPLTKTTTATSTSSASSTTSQDHASTSSPESKAMSSASSTSSQEPTTSLSSSTEHKQTSFDVLVTALRDKLGPSSGIADSDIDPADLEQLMREYVSREEDWERYAFRCPGKAYTRNLVDKGNGKSNLLILVWTPGRGSPVHDHANAHCIMKVLKGTLKETRYHWPTVNLNNNEQRPLQVQKETLFCENEVTYMSDKLGLHKISNPGSEFAVSLHLYTPPNAAIYGCNTFDEATGQPRHQSGCPVYSEYGRRTRPL